MTAIVELDRALGEHVFADDTARGELSYPWQQGRRRNVSGGPSPGLFLGETNMAQTRWLKCRASKGQFSDELAVRGADFRGEEFSFFAGRQYLDFEGDPESGEVEARLKVVEIGKQHDLVLIRLPGPTFGNGSTITVKEGQMLPQMACETA